MRLTDFALKKAVTVFVLMVIITVWGLYSYITLPKDAFPDITIPLIFISTPYFGTSPEDMENLVTRPIERKLKGMSDVKEITSTSQEGYSMIQVEFEAGTDVDNALQKVREKVDLAKPDLPEDSDDPILTEVNFSDIPIMVLNISGRMDLVGLKRIAEDLEDRIETIPGVLDAAVTGGLTREVQVNLDPERLRYYNLAVDDVIDAVGNENLNIPGGTIELGSAKYLVRVPGEFKEPERIKDIVVKVEKGRPIYIRNLAQVVYSFKERESISRLNGMETVSISVQKRSGENLIRIADRVKALVVEQQNRLPAGIGIKITGDQSKYIRDMVRDLENNVISGMLLVVLVLMLAMGVRNAILVSIAIPFSMFMSFLILSLMGQSMNTVVLFSMIMAVGMLVDNAVVIVENIFRHHQEGLNIREAASVGTNEVGLPVIASTVTTLVAFVPLLFWPGIMGEFMKYLPMTLIIILSCSLFVALVFNPTVCASFMRSRGPKKVIQAREDTLGPILVRYLHFLRLALRRPLATIGLAVSLLVGIIILYAFLGHGVELFPRVEPNKIYVDVKAPSGTNLETSDMLVRQVEKTMTKTKDLEDYVANVGSTGTDINFSFGGAETNNSRVMIDLLDFEDRGQNSFITLEQIRKGLTGITGAEIEVMEEEHGPPTGPPVNIEISGEDFATLGVLARDIREKIRRVEGLVNIKDNYDTGKPEVRVTVDREKAALLGVNTRDIAFTIRTAINGTEASTYRVGEDEYDITVRFARPMRSSIEDLRNLTIFYEGQQIPLANIARIETAGGVAKILHKDMKRVVTVSAEVEGRMPNEALQDCIKLLEDYPLQSGYLLEFTGENEEMANSEAFLTKAFVAAVALIALVLITQFNSIILPMIIMFSVILSTIGVLTGLMITWTPFGVIMTGIGVISLAGVVVNNAIILIDYIQQLRARGFEKTEAVIQAGLVRFRPVMLTAVTTILGLVPLTTGIGFDFIQFNFMFGGENSQWWGPMGVAVIFGLGFATILTLVVVPLMYLLLTNLTDRLGIAPAYIGKYVRETKDKPGSGIVR